MEALAFSGLLGFLRPSMIPKPRKITEDELTNIQEQKRLITDAAKVHKMLTVSFNLAMTNLAKKYELPENSSIDIETGELING